MITLTTNAPCPLGLDGALWQLGALVFDPVDGPARLEQLNGLVWPEIKRLIEVQSARAAPCQFRRFNGALCDGVQLCAALVAVCAVACGFVRGFCGQVELRRLRGEGHGLVVLEAAVMVEAGWHDTLCDEVKQ